MTWREQLALLLGAASPFALGSHGAAATEAPLPQGPGFVDPRHVQKDLLVFRDPAERERLLLFASHRSHSSHSSHRSHSSHYSGSGGHSSHSSHFSSSGGYVTPAPVLPRPAAPKPAAPRPAYTAPSSTYRAPSPPALTPSGLTSATPSTITQRLGSSELANMVTKVQIALVVRGYRPGPIDGRLGARTKDAISKFQTASKLPSTGFMDLETLQALGVDVAMPSRPASAAPPASALSITHPVWLKQPTAEDMARYYPDRATRMGVTGSAVISCEVTAQGTLENCAIVSETPAEYGFGDAAVRMMKLFKVEVSPQQVGARIYIPLSFTLPV